jgi:arsenic resistance protein ArsH
MGNAMLERADLPKLVPEAFERLDLARLFGSQPIHKARILMLYGSLRERSYSRLLTFEAQRLLNRDGGPFAAPS